MTLLGVDVSHYQGAPDWSRARAAGVAFAFAKATEGTSFTDPQFKANIAGMRAAGVVPGAYHFLRPGSVIAQANLFTRTAPADIIHALDVEASDLDVAGWVARYRTVYPTKPLLIYTGRDLWARAGGGNGSAFGPLWCAGYLPNAYVPGTGGLTELAAQVGAHRGGVPFGGWTAPTFLQFAGRTGQLSVAGIPGSVDGDIFYGTQAELVALTSVNPNASLQEPAMEWTDKIKLTAEDAKWWGGTYKEGDEVTIGTMLRFPTMTRRVETELAAFAAASATRDAAVLAAVQALAAGSADGIAQAFADGIAALDAHLEAIRITITTGSQ